MEQNNREKAVELEKKWQLAWESEGLYRADINSPKPHFYNLWMFPYPSAEGLHAGHAFASTGSDVFGRFMRMKGAEVFQPIGYDSFGIHSENYAIKIGQTPQQMLERTTANYERQMRSLGHGYDWSRTVTTSEPDYYKHTQWIFTTLFKSGLAYRKNARVNWCPSCKTVLSDEQVIDGACERCGTTVEHKNLTQWFFRITEYADKLLSGLDQIDWSLKVSAAQRQWIGKQEGFSIDFKLKNTDTVLTVWTKYWETVFGATFLVIAPEHPLLSQIKIPQEKSELVNKYISESLAKSEQERKAKTSKTGVDTGLAVINPVNGREIPLWIADYVMMDVGTGVVMGVPAHDKRDFDFAKEYNLPVIKVINPEGESSEVDTEFYEGPGSLVNSANFDGQSAVGEGKVNMANWMVSEGYGKFHTHYHLRDWLISRQRYWGAPIPMIYCENCAKNKKSYFDQKGEILRKDQDDWDHHGWYPVEDSALPVLLPEIADYKPKGEGTGPLADHPDFYKTVCPSCGSEAKRETDVCDTFLDSSWYFLRYPSVDAATSNSHAFDPEVTKNWLPVNLYFGGAEHSVLHLMYARFVTQVLFDLKMLNFSEPFPKFFAHGLMIKDGAKMSKSRGNVVNPDVYVEKFGADVMRLYLMFMGPMDGSPDFRDTGIEGMERFAKRLNGVMEVSAQQKTTGDLERLMHKTIKKVSYDMDSFAYNTAIASIMEFVNSIYDRKDEFGEDAKRVLCLLLAPFAPHLAEQWWRDRLGEEVSVHKSNWPVYEESKLVSDSLIITVQVNGKLRGQITVSKEQSENEELVLDMAKQLEQVTKYISDQEIKKNIYIKGRTVNLVV